RRQAPGGDGEKRRRFCGRGALAFAAPRRPRMGNALFARSRGGPQRRARSYHDFQQPAHSGGNPATEVQPNHAFTLAMQRFKVAESQRTLQLAEAVTRAGNGDVAFLGGSENQENASRRAALQNLSEIVEIARAE